MGRRRKVEGHCRLCGEHGKLSFEHIPPEAAFNNQSHFYRTSLKKIAEVEDEFLRLSYSQLHKKKLVEKKQGGIGFYTLCPKCNNDTGSWYGSAFVEWVYQSMGILLKAAGEPTLIYPTRFYPLRTIKQIVTMFFSVNLEGFREHEPELVKFVLNREERFMPKKFRVFCYYNIEGSNRYIGENVVYAKGRTTVISEISFPPLGFVLTQDNSCPDTRLTDITHFANYEYLNWTEHYQRFATLPTHLPYPADYRTKEEIAQAIADSYKYRKPPR